MRELIKREWKQVDLTNFPELAGHFCFMSITRGESLYDCVFYNSRRSALFVIWPWFFKRKKKDCWYANFKFSTHNELKLNTKSKHRDLAR